jgi:addiction module HigA family antidote
MPSRSAPRTSTEPASRPRDPAVLGPLVHPGEMLLEEFLRPLGVRQSVVADELDISRNRLNQLVLGKRSVTADTAIPQLRLSIGSPSTFALATRRRQATRSGSRKKCGGPEGQSNDAV